MNLQQMRAAIGAEFKAVDSAAEAEIHKFLNWVEGAEQARKDAIDLLTAAGYTVTAPV